MIDGRRAMLLAFLTWPRLEVDVAGLCQTCGIRLDSDGLCQCPAVLLAEVERLAGEKDARIYYQSIVYAVCNSLDKIAGHSVRHGRGVVCGTLETPTTEVEDAMRALEVEIKRLRDALNTYADKGRWATFNITTGSVFGGRPGDTGVAFDGDPEQPWGDAAKALDAKGGG